MRLIDADNIKFEEDCTFSGKGLNKFINAIPTAYDVDRVEERLNEKAIPEDKVMYASPDEYGLYVLLKDAIEIAKAGGVNE